MEYLTHREIQAALFDLLCAFDDFATRNDIRYSLAGGTLLGAVRHGGFIPWDDDIDVVIPRPDYDRLLSLRSKVDAGYRIVGPLDEGLPYPFAKFCDLTIRSQEACLSNVVEEYLWVDLFPLDGIPSDLGAARSQFKRVQRLKMGAARKTIPSRSAMKEMLKAPYRLIANAVYPAEKDYAEIDAIGRSTPFGSTRFCKEVTWSPYPNTAYRAADFDDLTSLRFESREFPVVVHWDEALRSAYGDYMKLPPEGQRQVHDVLAWRIEEGPS